MDRPTAAVLLIGNEILSGRIRDENLPFLASQLWSLGIALRRVEVCRDELAEIAAAVRRLAAGHSWLFTTGGIGPTHDDVTIEGVARAFGVRVVTHPHLEEMIREHFGEAVRPAHLRMAWAPEGATLEGQGDGAWPTVRLANVLILPGVPSILRRKFVRLVSLFEEAAPFERRALTFLADEADLAPVLEQAALEHPTVEIGSYPEKGRVLVTFEGDDEEELEAAIRQVDEGTAGVPRAPVL